MSVALTVHAISRAGIDMLTSFMVAADAGGNHWTGTGAEFVAIANASVGAITVTEVITRLVDGQTPAPRTVSVPAGKTYFLGPYPTADYNDGSNLVHLTFSGVTTLTIGAFSLNA